MRRSRDPFPETLAAAVADGAPIDWATVETAAGGATNAELVRQLRVIAEVRRGRPAVLGVPRSRHAAVWIFFAGAAVAAAKVLVALLALPPVLLDPALRPAAWPYALNLVTFGVGGLAMIGGGGRDRRLQLLGGLYLTIAVAFVGPFLAPAATGGAPLVDLLAICLPESFFALGVWLFAWAFPAEPVGPRTQKLATVAIALAAFVVSVLFLAGLATSAQDAWAVDLPRGLALLALFDRRSLTSMYWPTFFALVVPAVPFFIAKARLETPDRRRKVSWFLTALVIGIAPIIVAAIAAPFLPALHEPDTRRAIGLIVYVSLASIVPTTAYAVAVNHVMDWQVVVKAALRYALARYAIRVAIVAPLAYLAIDVFVHRGLTILQYLELQRPAGLLALSGFGLAALTFRPQLIHAVDRWFLREPLDAPQALARLDHRFRTGEHIRDVSTALADELTRSLHAERVTVLLLADDGASLLPLDDTVPPIPRDSVLLDLLHSTRAELHLDQGSATATLLPEADQDWLQATGAGLLSPLIGASGTLLGVAAIAAGTDELPYTDRHAALVATMCGQAALQLENRWLRQAQGSTARSSAPGSGVGWQDEPAVFCTSCGRTWSPDIRRCRCGSAVRPAALPLFVNAKFRLHRMLGTGGTGVVYLATDLALDRKVAVKALRPMRREYAARLRREARAMAAVRHPNLATIFGLEEWHETPLLIVEYLEGGTLLDALAQGPRPIGETLDLGIVLADALDRVHGSGVLHRDIKPSNIGFSSDGTPKLLDFGLAAMLDGSAGEGGPGHTTPFDTSEFAGRLGNLSASGTLTASQHVVGTPLYLSPEALAGSSPRESFDLWSLTLVLYEAIAGRHPLAGRPGSEVVEAIQHAAIPDIRERRPDCPAVVAAFLTDALSRVASRRPASARALRTELRGLRARLDQTS